MGSNGLHHPAPDERKDRVVSSLTNRLSSVVLGMAVIALLVFGIGPHTGTYRTLTILSDSMKPAFSSGDVIIATPTKLQHVRAGHVISYRAPVDGKPLVTHRVTKVISSGRNPVVQTKGDSNSAVDPWTARLGGDGPVWRQRAVIPYVGNAIRILRQPAIRSTTIYALPIVLVLLALNALWRPARRDDTEMDWDLTGNTGEEFLPLPVAGDTASDRDQDVLAA